MQVSDDIIIRVLEGKATREEFVAMKDWLQEETNRQHFEDVREIWSVIGGPELSSKQEAQEWLYLKKYMQQSRRKHIFKVCWRYAAILIFLIMIPFVILRLHDQENILHPVIQRESLIIPGNFQAILTVSNGESIELKPTNAKRIEVGESGEAINGNEGLVYNNKPKESSVTEYNQVSTPFGGEYTIILADGTKVHLNAGSALRFPVAFNDSLREVYLSGEAYFEVQEDVTKPFLVQTDVVNLKVYGTSFNVNTFERTEAVLYSGSIGVKGMDMKEHILKPSQLIEYDKSGLFVRICEVDTRVYLAWKEGYFFFDNENLANVLATLERWYNVKFEYKEIEIQKMHFTGYVEKYENIGVILNAIERIAHVHFNINGRTIKVVKERP